MNMCVAANVTYLLPGIADRAKLVLGNVKATAEAHRGQWVGLVGWWVGWGSGWGGVVGGVR